jgi:hypothetical protein
MNTNFFKNKFMKTAVKKRPDPIQVRIPIFVAGGGRVGLGDVISRATSAVGVKPCAGCRQRADALNRRVVFGRVDRG